MNTSQTAIGIQWVNCSVLHPVFVHLCINDLRIYIEHATVSMYADDTAIYYTPEDIDDIRLAL